MKLLLPLLALSASGAAFAQTPSPPPPGAPHVADTNRDGTVTRDEALADADRRFAAMDADGNGTVTGEERRAYRDAHRPGPARGAHLRDGGPPAPERAREGRGGRDMTRAQFRDRAGAMFDRTDTNRDGRIDPQEREAARLLMRARMVDGRD